MRPPALRSAGFDRPLVVAGAAGSSRWGYDPDLECYWAEVHVDGSPGEAGGTAGPVTARAGAVMATIGTEHLLLTLDSLARTLAAVLGVPDQDAYLALTSS